VACLYKSTTPEEVTWPSYTGSISAPVAITVTVH
jgi:hypothetical protein